MGYISSFTSIPPRFSTPEVPSKDFLSCPHKGCIPSHPRQLYCLQSIARQSDSTASFQLLSDLEGQKGHVTCQSIEIRMFRVRVRAHKGGCCRDTDTPLLRSQVRL